MCRGEPSSGPTSLTSSPRGTKPSSEAVSGQLSNLVPQSLQYPWSGGEGGGCSYGCGVDKEGQICPPCQASPSGFTHHWKEGDP